MKKTFLLLVLLTALQSQSQTVFGYWYGYANVKSSGPTSNYLVELILQPQKGIVTGVLNYYFKNSFRSLAVKGNFDANGRLLNLYNIPITYHGSNNNMEIDCMMNLRANLRVAKAGSNLIGTFSSLPDQQYMCRELTFNLSFNEDISKQDSVLKAIREYKEEHQVWMPTSRDTLTTVRIIQRKVVNYYVENLYKQRENIVAQEIPVASGRVSVDFYDNGEVDGDSISVFFNNELMAYSQRLSTSAIHFDLVLDSTRQVNEITMFADNLGSIPPNTALMIVTDGDKHYEVRLSSSLQKNATLRLRREPAKKIK